MTQARRPLNAPLQAVLYARFSPRPNGKMCESDVYQVARMTEYCHRMGYEVYGEPFVDKLFSGANMNRPALKKALKLVCKIRGVLVIYNLARLTRSHRDALTISDMLKKHRAGLASVCEQFDTTTPTGQFFFSMLANFANYQRESINERSSYVMREHVRNGRRMSHVDALPFGTMLDPNDSNRTIPNPKEVATIELMDSLRSHGHTMESVAQQLNKTPGHDRRGLPWNRRKVWKYLHALAERKRWEELDVLRRAKGYVYRGVPEKKPWAKHEPSQSLE